MALSRLKLPFGWRRSLVLFLEASRAFSSQGTHWQLRGRSLHLSGSLERERTWSGVCDSAANLEDKLDLSQAITFPTSENASRWQQHGLYIFQVHMILCNVLYILSRLVLSFPSRYSLTISFHMLDDSLHLNQTVQGMSDDAIDLQRWCFPPNTFWNVPPDLVQLFIFTSSDTLMGC